MNVEDIVKQIDPDDPKATVCGHCGKAWDDSISTSMTPTPSGRCPFEYDHEYPEGTHDYNTKFVLGKDLDHTMVLVGDSGGLCAIYANYQSGAMPGLRALETEHGPLYLDPDEEYSVYDD